MTAKAIDENTGRRHYQYYISGEKFYENQESFPFLLSQFGV